MPTSHAREPLELKSFWGKLNISPLTLSLILFLVLTGLKAYGFLGGELHQATPVLVSYLLMWVAPLLILTPLGREQIGFGQTASFAWILIAVGAGAALAAIFHQAGLLLYGKSEQHWFSSVAYTLQSDDRITLFSQKTAFYIFSVPAVLASPVGEELFFRGLIERAGRDRFDRIKAAIIAAGLFAAAQIFIHGIYRAGSGLELMTASGSIWIFLMFTAGLFFSYLRYKSGSIWPPILCHATFNFTVTYFVFYSILVSHPRT